MNWHYILLDIINRCNKTCDYCVMKEWRNNPKYPDKLTWQQLGIHFKKYDHADTGMVVDITGGEPTLFPDLLTVLDMLKHYGAKVILRTNGFNLGHWLNKYPNLIVILAKHDTDEKEFRMMKKYLRPWDLIQTGIDPKQFQQPNEIFKYIRNEENKDVQHEFQSICFITNGSEIKGCPGEVIAWDFCEGFKNVKKAPCGHCPYANLAWDLAFNYLPED